ncbi:MAG TPA: hypothetical protein VLC46_24305 [Thermoanaerobaculia bacterium]|jgi:hypothetical protein|nr:hypothetical protein [Thermoanaerobaculia bacterium]
MDAQELMIEHPFGIDGILDGLAADLPRQGPLPGQVVEQVIVEDPFRPVERVVGCRRNGSAGEGAERREGVVSKSSRELVRISGGHGAMI